MEFNPAILPEEQGIALGVVNRPFNHLNTHPSPPTLAAGVQHQLIHRNVRRGIYSAAVGWKWYSTACDE